MIDFAGPDGDADDLQKRADANIRRQYHDFAIRIRPGFLSGTDPPSLTRE
jgi:hypothetical protein